MSPKTANIPHIFTQEKENKIQKRKENELLFIRCFNDNRLCQTKVKLLETLAQHKPKYNRVEKERKTFALENSARVVD